MKEKVVIITGGSSGIGKALAEVFGSHGAKIVVTGRKKETLDESIFYNPTKEISAFVYPQIEEWYEKGVQFSEDSEQE